MICLLATTIGAGQGHQTALQTGPDTLPPYAGYVGITMPANITCNPSDPGDCKCEGLPIGPSTFTPPAYSVSNHTSIYATHAPMEGVMVPLSRYRARAALVVNVASA